MRLDPGDVLHLKALGVALEPGPKAGPPAIDDNTVIIMLNDQLAEARAQERRALRFAAAALSVAAASLAVAAILLMGGGR
jgi:hypothetical protein